MSACTEVSSRSQGIGACQPSKWTRQFMQPTGWRGRVIGRLMAIKNEEIIRFAVECLNLQPDDHVMEVGFGSGTAIERIAARIGTGHVSGVDRSPTMVQQATTRNRRAIEQGLVELLEGDVAKLSYEDGRFSKVLAVNTFHIWPNQRAGLLEIRRVLQRGGCLLLALRHQHPTRRWLVPPGFTPGEIQQVAVLLQEVGFVSVRRHSQQSVQEVTCLEAHRP